MGVEDFPVHGMADEQPASGRMEQERRKTASSSRIEALKIMMKRRTAPEKRSAFVIGLEDGGLGCLALNR